MKNNDQKYNEIARLNESNLSAVREQLEEYKDQLAEINRNLSRYQLSSESKLNELQEIISDNKSSISKLETELKELKGANKKDEEEKENSNKKVACPHGDPNCKIDHSKQQQYVYYPQQRYYNFVG